MNTDLSIITINYNNLEGLKKTINSVLNQSFKDFEYIVIDGGSTDGSLDFIKKHKDKITYWISEQDDGVYNAMNKGIAQATGDYLLFLNSGDHFCNSKALEKNHKYIREKDIIYFNLEVVRGDKTFIKDYPDKLSFSYFVKDTLPHPATFIKNEAMKNFGPYDDNLKIAADWKFFIDGICKYQLSYKRIDKVLSTFYMDGMSSNSDNKKIINSEKQSILQSEYAAYFQDLEDVIEFRNIINSLRNSRIIKLLVKLKFLNKI